MAKFFDSMIPILDFLNLTSKHVVAEDAQDSVQSYLPQVENEVQ